MIKYVKYWREALIVILVIVAATSIRSCNVNADSVDVLSHKADSFYKKATYYVNKNKELVGQVNTHELTIKDLKKHGDALGFEIKDLKGKVVRMDGLVAYWQGKAKIHDTVHAVLHDTIFHDKTGQEVLAKSFKWNNKFLFLDGVVAANDITIVYEYNVSFSLTAYRKPQRGFWKPPGQLVADIYFNDPAFKVRQFSGFVIKENRKRWYETRGAAIGLGFVGGTALYVMTR